MQRVVVDGQYSARRYVISGVPQGSVLDPLLFILYTHDIWFGLENMLVAYVDDAKVCWQLSRHLIRDLIYQIHSIGI